MREGLAREFPEAVRAAAWTRGRVARSAELRHERAPWATLSGIGAGFLVSAIAQALVVLTVDALQALGNLVPLFRFSPLVTIAGISVATAVALRVGGRIAFALYVGYIALGLALGITGLITFCERSGAQLGFPDLGQCTLTGYLTGLWPHFVGFGLGVFLTRAITTRSDGINSLLRIAGAYAIAQFVFGHIWAFSAQDANVPTSGLTIGAGLSAAAVAAGVVAAQLPRSIRNALIVAAVSLLPWLTLLPTALSNLGPPRLPAEFLGPTLFAIVISPIAAAFLVLSAAVASRARFVPRDAA